MTTELMSADLTSDAQAIIDLAQTSADPHVLEPGGYYVVRTADGLTQIDLTADKWLDQPMRKRGTVTVRDAASFLAYWAKHSTPASEIYADRDKLAVTAVIDAHGAEENATDWGQHRLVLQLRYSPAFAAWLKLSGQLVGQTQFAEFIEDRRGDIREPTAAEVLELAQTFQATTKVSFRSSARLKSGARQLNYAEEVNAAAGQLGELTVPDELQLAVAIFDGAAVADAVTARLRYRIGDGQLRLGVVLDQVAEVVDGAFAGVVDEVKAGTVGLPVLFGTPA
jgi:uncharacterized protein YfdQ (DUF2303 family)